jgi:ribose 5-phosphate isomerase A
MTNVETALSMIQDGTVIGLGSGKAAWKFIESLGEKVRAGMKVSGIPASEASADLARKSGIPLVELTPETVIDITFDGADEVAPNMDLLKGWGHALVREKIIAAAAKKFVVLVGPERVEEKMVKQIGERGRLPVEVVPFAAGYCQRELTKLGMPGEPLRENGKIFLSDNGNYILEVKTSGHDRWSEVEKQICALPGVVDTGLFLGMAHQILIQWPDRLEVRDRK